MLYITGDAVRAYIHDDDDPRLDRCLRRILTENGYADLGMCPKCGAWIDRGFVRWNSRSTEAGTGYSVLDVECEACAAEIAHATSWYSEISGFGQFVMVLADDIERRL